MSTYNNALSAHYLAVEFALKHEQQTKIVASELRLILEARTPKEITRALFERAMEGACRDICIDAPELRVGVTAYGVYDKGDILLKRGRYVLDDGSFFQIGACGIVTSVKPDLRTMSDKGYYKDDTSKYTISPDFILTKPLVKNPPQI